MNDLSHMAFVRAVTDSDAVALDAKERKYGGSWKKRGGVGAFMMMARKWDRLENVLSNPSEGPDGSSAAFSQYDVFGAIQFEASDFGEGTLDQVRDLRRYLVLIEAELMARGVVKGEVPEDEVPTEGGWAPPKPAPIPAPDEKPGQYELAVASNETDAEKTITIKNPANPSEYQTTLSVADTVSILRGDPLDSFEADFIGRIIGNWFGRQICAFSQDGDRLVVIHL